MEKNSCGTGEEKVKKRKTHNKHTLGEPGDMTVHKNKFGFVEIENPVYYNNNYNHAPPQFLMRKATPEERREMVVNYIIRRNGKPIIPICRETCSEVQSGIKRRWIGQTLLQS